jgi:hypothetical protein
MTFGGVCINSYLVHIDDIQTSNIINNTNNKNNKVSSKLQTVATVNLENLVFKDDVSKICNIIIYFSYINYIYIRMICIIIF